MRCGTVDSVGRTSKLVTGPFAATGVLASVVAAPFAALATAVAAPLTALALLATAVTALGAPAGAAEVVGEPYVVAAETGGDVLTLGEAPFHGSMGDTPLNQPIVAMATTPPATATGSQRPTAASTPSATPTSTAPSAAMTATLR